MRFAIAAAAAVAVALAATGPASAATVTFAGTTTQGADVRLRSDEAAGLVQRVDVRFRVRCRGGAHRGRAVFRLHAFAGETFALARTYRSAGRRVRARVAGTWGPDATWRGTFAATVRGGGRRCAVRGVRWAAAPPPEVEPQALRPQVFVPRDWSVTFAGDPGEYVSGGAARAFGPPDRIEVWVHKLALVRVMIVDRDGASWQLEFDSPATERLAARRYAPADGFPFNAFPEPGLAVGGDHRACSDGRGAFTIEELGVRDHRLESLRIAFEQRCGDRPETLRGALQLRP